MIKICKAGVFIPEKAFKEGLDPHAITAEALYGQKWRDAEYKSAEWENMRNFAKTFDYVVFYGAGDSAAGWYIYLTDEEILAEQAEKDKTVTWGRAK